MKGIFKSLVFIMVGVLMFGLVGCGNSSKKKSDSVTTSTTSTEDKTKDKDNDKPRDAKLVLKDVPVEGKVTDEEKSKIVDLTEKTARLAIEDDYTKDTIANSKQFFEYTTDDIKKDWTDDKIQKMLDGQKKIKEIVKVEDITYKNITSTPDGIIVDFTAKILCKSHTDPNKNGKEFDMNCRFMYNKDFKISAYKIDGV